MDLSLGSRNLYEAIFAYKGNTIFADVVLPWVKNNDYKTFLLSINIDHDLSVENKWELYALSRVLDIMTLRFQPDRNADRSNWQGPVLSLNEYIEFNSLIGLALSNPEKYHAFDCEILEAQPGDLDFDITDVAFPSSRLKNLLIKRSGVSITLNPKEHNLPLLNNSAIYWTFRRKNRRYKDLSQGWGSNSQWATSFRMDIETNEKFTYNESGKIDLNNITNEGWEVLKDQKLELAEAIELIRNRCFVSCTKDDSDLFPYDFKYSEFRNYKA